MKTLMLTSLIGILILLNGCAATKITDLREFTKADALQAAQVATAAGDTVAADCYTAIANNLQPVVSLPEGQNGALVAFEHARLMRMFLSAGVPTEVHLRCSPLIVDAQTTMLRLGILVR